MKRIITGIKPTGDAHIGNYFGAIKKIIEMQNNKDCEFFCFIADLHAMTSIRCKEELKENIKKIAAIWIACGLDPKKAVFYKQSDISEISELAVVLNNYTSKGLMNRAHAYKALVDKNRENSKDDDYNINLGLFCYPALMAADILLFNANLVPVGKDQFQHIEIARDIANTFNSAHEKYFVLPEPIVSVNEKTILGLDGRKMSKSYKNTISLMLEENMLKKTVRKIITDSTPQNESKGTDNTVFELYQLFANIDECNKFERLLQSGIGWGQAKDMLFDKMNEKLKNIRETYNTLMADPSYIDELLKEGAKKAKIIAKENLKCVKELTGLI